jgi:phasin family protein
MTQFDFSKFFDVDAAAKFGPEGVYPFDYSALLEIGRKNFQALNEAHQLALSSYHSLARRQSELLSELVEENSDIGQVLFTEGTPQEKFIRQIDVAKTLYEHGVRHSRAISDIIRKSGNDAADVLNHRVSASLNEFKGALNKKPAKAKAAAAPAKKARETA